MTTTPAAEWRSRFAALQWASQGASVIPVATDGTKRPAIPWKGYQQHAADTAQIHAWFDEPRYGLGLVCGAVSGHLEMLEFEGRAVEAGMPTAFREALDDHGQIDLWNILAGGYMETTPAGGLHLLYRVDGQARGNTKLARRPATDEELADNPRDKVKVLIETRGEGGFVVVAPTGGHAHPSGRPWTTLVGSPATIPTLTTEQRDTLYAIATLLDQMPVAAPMPAPDPLDLASPGGHTSGTRPGDDYNARATWDELLGDRGWSRMWRLGSGYGWRRPGKADRSISATTGTSADGADRLYVFSSSTEFDTETPYSKFAAYAHLEHGGNYGDAAKTLAAAGYGSPPTQDRPPVQPQQPTPPRRLQVVPPPPDEAPTDGSSALKPDPGITTMRHSDDGNASALIHLHGTNIRYCPERARWLTWDTTRWTWEPSGGGHVRELVKDTAHQMPAGKGSEEWRKRSLSAIGTTNTLTQAATDQRVTIALADLDAAAWSLNTPGGVVDLRTGVTTPARPDELHTRITEAAPDRDADTAVWDRFLATTFGDDDELIGYLQRLIGYSATGYIGPHVLPFAHGSGGNGKGVFLETVSAVLGEYATSAPNAFLMARNYSQHETEIARLAGARMVICSEVNEHDRFDEAKVKQLTGGDTLTARFMRQDHFTFQPTHHLWLIGNHKPAVTSGGRSFWRRCRLVPFDHEVDESERVDDLQGILARDHGPAILNWIVQGAVAFAQGGLAEPASVTDATQEYAHDQDTVLRFVEEACHRTPHVKVAVREIFTAYERWCVEVGEHPVTGKRFAQELFQRFDVRPEKSNGRRLYSGITLLTITDESDPANDGDDRDAWWKE